jgi:hypothetical protein
MVRVGLIANTGLHWREDNYRPTRVEGKRNSSLAVWPPNIGYAKVSPEQQVEFDEAIDSFVREVDRAAPLPK